MVASCAPPDRVGIGYAMVRPIMSTLLFIAALIVVPVLFGVVAFVRGQARDGYEDAVGFHYGTPPRRR